MELKTIFYQSKQISYSVVGKNGPNLFFVHGYLEYKEIWQSFIKHFKQNYRILCIDLPGHGMSDSIGPIHSMTEIATIIKLILDTNEIKKTTLIGHSMGGYVSLAFADLYPEMLERLILFSSSALSDSTEKKIARNRDIELIKRGEKELIIDQNIHNMFYFNNLVKFSTEIERIKTKVKLMNDKAIIATLEGMKMRINYQALLKELSIPKLFIAGKYDNLIQIDVSERQIKNCTNLLFNVLENSGHMGYIEEELESANSILSFLKN